MQGQEIANVIAALSATAAREEIPKQEPAAVIVAVVQRAGRGAFEA